MNFKNLAAVAAVAVAALAAVSCGKEKDTSFKGKNTIKISSATTSELIAKNGEELKLNLLLTTSLASDLTLTFDFIDGKVGDTPVVEFAENPITIKAGEKTASLTVKAVNVGEVDADMPVKVTLKESSDDKVSLGEDFRFIVKPRVLPQELTEAQKALIDGYLAKGLDLMHWIGEVPVKVELKVPGDEGTIKPYLNPQERNFEGTTVITLSEKATADKPVLKMVSNAMGLRAFLYEALRNMTVLDDEYWTQTPAPQKVMELIGLSKESQESFELALDDIALNTADKSIDYVSKIFDEYEEEEIGIVNFIYSYSAWDRLKKLIDDGNQEAVEVAEQGGTVDPAEFFNYSRIDTDGWDGENWFQYTSSFDSATGEMKFEFPMDFSALGDYMKVYVTYNSAK